MTANRRIFLNIVATYPDRAVGDIDRAQPVRRSLYARTIGLVCGRGTLMTLDMPKLTMEAKFS